ncbi:chloride channel protein [Pseudoroseomonas cervicalis]|uniref:Chloride transporter, ClC family n=1 Tax=Pseudoroseomonas cervicalis ATCC 49957 TaxID=525371 RepID=D5RLB6_9PROT|nr:chloride channel protein [Pseudoroseomonas cervicalis]EFH11903.1 chloride transporter, ClC family [Pseudoroseomonas cervicalis ATCC 49957]
MSGFRTWLQQRVPGGSLRDAVRQSELGILLLGTLAGLLSGLLAAALGGAARGMHLLIFGPESQHGLSALRDPEPLLLLLAPATGGLLLGLLGLALARWRPRQPIDPIEANALHGGRMSLWDGVVVGAQNLLSNGFGASVGLEAAYTQAGGGAASRMGRAFGLRRGDLRVLVGCGAAGAIAAAFGAPLTGAFYAFELVIGSYAIAYLAPVLAAAVAGSLVTAWLGGGTQLLASGLGAPDWDDTGLSLLIGLACGLAGIALMRGVTVTEAGLRRAIPWGTLRPAVGGLAVGALALVTPAVLSAGHGALHLAFVVEGPALPLVTLLLLKALASAISIGAGFRGGLFFASLLLGALLGKLVASGALALGIAVDPLLGAIVGMTAFGAAVIGAPLAMTLLALETTGSFAIAGVVVMAVIVSATTVRRLFGYSFATWRFHLRGEAIRSAHDVGWLHDLTVGKLMRRDIRTVRQDTRISAFRRDFPLGATTHVVALDAAGRYAGMILVAEAHAPELEEDATVEGLLHLAGQVLLPAQNAKQAMALFDATDAEALAVVDQKDTSCVIGLVKASYLLRRYSEELDKRRQDELGMAA